MKKKQVSQYERVRDRILHQAELVLNKFKPSSSREITNQEIALLLYSYSTGSTPCERKLELVHAGLAKLSIRQMAIVNKVYFQGMSQVEVAREMKVSKQYIEQELSRAFKIIKSVA